MTVCCLCTTLLGISVLLVSFSHLQTYLSIITGHCMFSSRNAFTFSFLPALFHIICTIPFRSLMSLFHWLEIHHHETGVSCHCTQTNKANFITNPVFHAPPNKLQNSSMAYRLPILSILRPFIHCLDTLPQSLQVLSCMVQYLADSAK